MAYKTAKNLLSNRDVYNRYYGDFRGVDFSSDHTQVHDQRLAYAVNMYKDYQSGQGQAIETIPGFRRRVIIPGNLHVYAIHRFQHRDGNGVVQTKVLIHAGDKLYLWYNYPLSVGVIQRTGITLPEETSTFGDVKTFDVEMPENVASVTGISRANGEAILSELYAFDAQTHTLTISGSDLSEEDVLQVSYKEGDFASSHVLRSAMNTAKSTSFIFNNRLYLIDGTNYLYYDGTSVHDAVSAAYIPTTYINIIPAGENADIGREYEQRNILQSLFKHTFIADGTTTVFKMNDNMLDDITEVKVYGVVKRLNTDYNIDKDAGTVTFVTAPQKPEEVQMGDAAGVNYPEFYAGVEITAKKEITSVSGVVDSTADVSGLISGCTIATVFDNRVFLSGNPLYPNHIFFCGRNSTGYVDPTYFGILNYQQDGVGMTPIRGMIPVADTLMVLKGDTQQDGSVYFHSPQETGIDLYPKQYPSQQGLAGIGCLGACVNFLDDPIFISRLGVEAVGQLSVRYERAVEHRSSLIDAKLVNLDLSKAVLDEWGGYLCLLVDGKMFLADSRQKYTNSNGTVQYEWYYLEDIGVWDDQYPEFLYASQIYPELDGKKIHYCPRCNHAASECTCDDDDEQVEIPLSIASEVFYADTGETKNLVGSVANPPDADGEETKPVFRENVDITIEGKTYSFMVCYSVHEVYDSVTEEFVRYEAFLCDEKGNYTGGTFRPASSIRSMDGNLFFGTESGVVCSFNFDMRDESGDIAPRYYNFDERTILCGCATKMDCCGIPHLTKNTVKKSTVIKTKSFQSSAAKIKVRTNKKPYEQIARINSSQFSFDDMDFSDFSFITTEQSLFAVKEKEKKWVEKQYYVYSDEYMKPFSLYYISFRYSIAGRYKQ